MTILIHGWHWQTCVGQINISWPLKHEESLYINGTQQHHNMKQHLLKTVIVSDKIWFSICFGNQNTIKNFKKTYFFCHQEISLCSITKIEEKVGSVKTKLLLPLNNLLYNFNYCNYCNRFWTLLGFLLF